MTYENTKCSLFFILLKLLLLLILNSAELAASSLCERVCGGIKITYPFGIGNGCHLDKYYEIDCRDNSTSRKVVPFLFAISREVVSISLPNEEIKYASGSSMFAISKLYGLVRVKTLITSTECFRNGKNYAGSAMNLSGSPFFSDGLNSLTAVGCNAKVSLMHIKPNTVVCELNCNTNKDSHINNIHFLNKTECSIDIFPDANNQVCTAEDEPECDGNECCQVGLPNDPQQVIGIRIKRNDGDSMRTRDRCRVAFLTDEVYTLSNATKPQELFAKGYATIL